MKAYVVFVWLPFKRLTRDYQRVCIIHVWWLVYKRWHCHCIKKSYIDVLLFSAWDTEVHWNAFFFFREVKCRNSGQKLCSLVHNLALYLNFMVKGNIIQKVWSSFAVYLQRAWEIKIRKTCFKLYFFFCIITLTKLYTIAC